MAGVTGNTLTALLSYEQARAAYETFKTHQAAMRSIRAQAVTRFEQAFETDQELRGYAVPLQTFLERIPEYDTCETRPHRARPAAFAGMRKALKNAAGATHRSQIGRRCTMAKDVSLDAAQRTIQGMVTYKKIEDKYYDSFLEMQTEALLNMSGDTVYLGTIADGLRQQGATYARLASDALKSQNAAISTFTYSLDQLFKPDIRDTTTQEVDATAQGIRTR